MKKYVIDTSALFAYIENEEGYDKLEALLHEAIEEKVELVISVVSCIEVFYISLQEQAENVAEERLRLINDLPVKLLPLDPPIIKTTGEMKAKFQMSFADCCIAAQAKYSEAYLVHKDPEYEQVENQIKQIKLPYKA